MNRLWDAIKSPFQSYWQEVQNEWQQFWENTTNDFFDIFIVACILGVFLLIAGFDKWGKRLTLGSIILAMFFRMVRVYV